MIPILVTNSAEAHMAQAQLFAMGYQWKNCQTALTFEHNFTRNNDVILMANPLDMIITWFELNPRLSESLADVQAKTMKFQNRTHERAQLIRDIHEPKVDPADCDQCATEGNCVIATADAPCAQEQPSFGEKCNCTTICDCETGYI